MVATVTKAMTEQAAGMKEIAGGGGRHARAVGADLASASRSRRKTMREMTAAAQNTAKQIKLITKANIEHSSAASALLTSVDGNPRRSPSATPAASSRPAAAPTTCCAARRRW